MYVCMYVCMHVRTYGRMYVCMQACMHVCMLTSTPKGCSQPRELWFFDNLMYACMYMYVCNQKVPLVKNIRYRFYTDLQSRLNWFYASSSIIWRESSSNVMA